MERTPWRRLSFDDARFGWRVIHEHHVLPKSGPGEGRCREVLTAAPEDRRGSLLRLEFTDGPECNAGYPEAGVVWFSSGSRLSANLNLPRMARAAIEVALESGWKPWGPRGWKTLDGWPLLEAIVRRYDELGDRKTVRSPRTLVPVTRPRRRRAADIRQPSRLERRERRQARNRPS